MRVLDSVHHPSPAMQLAAVFLLCFASNGASAEMGPLEEFRVPTPEEFNVTVSNWTSGYNPWMPQYIGGRDPTKPTYVMLAEGCLSEEESGSTAFFREIANGWQKTCENLGMECICRPNVKIEFWNVGKEIAYRDVYQGIHHCAWELRRLLDEHKRGLIKLAGITTKCHVLEGPGMVYDEARELGVPVFLIDANPPLPGDDNYGITEPDGYVGADDAFIGRTLAKVLKQLRPEGVKYAFVMQWEGGTSKQRRNGFNEEMIVQPSDKKTVPVWSEVERYPYERPYNLSVPCHHMDCQMDGLVANTTVDAMIFLFQSPLRNPKFMDWVDANRSRNFTLISVGTLDFLHLLNTGYLDGLVGQIAYEYGKRSAEVLLDIVTKLASHEITLPLKEKFFETKLVSYNVIPLNLDNVYPPQLDQNLLGNLVYVGIVGYGIVLASALFCGVWTIYNRSAMVVRAAQPFFLIILLSGVVIFASTVVPLSFDDAGELETTDEGFAVGVCMAQPWLAFTGFTVIFAALFSKTWRVNRLFHSQQRHSRVEIYRMDVLAPFAVTFTCNVVILTCWTIIDPLMYTRLLGDGTDFWNRDIETYGACRSDKALAFLIPLAVINFVVLGIACWQAFEGRNIESAFSESKYIGLSVACLFQAFLAGFPILVIVKDVPRPFYMVLTLMILVLSEGILLLIFLPKIYMAYIFSSMTESEQKKVMSEQISRSTARTSTAKSKMLASSSIPENGSKFFRAMAPVKNVIREVPREMVDDAIVEDRHDAGAAADADDSSSALRLARAAASIATSSDEPRTVQEVSTSASSEEDPSGATNEHHNIDDDARGTSSPSSSERHMEVGTKIPPIPPMPASPTTSSQYYVKESTSSKSVLTSVKSEPTVTC